MHKWNAEKCCFPTCSTHATAAACRQLLLLTSHSVHRMFYLLNMHLEIFKVLFFCLFEDMCPVPCWCYCCHGNLTWEAQGEQQCWAFRRPRAPSPLCHLTGRCSRCQQAEPECWSGQLWQGQSPVTRGAEKIGHFGPFLLFRDALSFLLCSSWSVLIAELECSLCDSQWN